MRLFNAFNQWSHGDVFTHVVVVVAAIYCGVAVFVMVAS